MRQHDKYNKCSQQKCWPLFLCPFSERRCFMKSRAEQLDEISKAILIATDRIRYYKQQDKMLQSEIKRLTRNERTHRLCTRGGMIEAFIQEPEKLSDDQVMELLSVAFRQPEVSGLLQKMLEETKANPLPEG